MKKLEPLTSLYVTEHAKHRAKRGRLVPVVRFGHIRNPSEALLAAHRVMKIRVENAPQAACTFGFSKPEFTIHTPLIVEEFDVVVRRRVSTLTLRFGLLRFKTEQTDMVLHDTFLIEIETDTPSAVDHMNQLPLGGFGSMICFDYAEAGKQLVAQFCEAMNLAVSSELNHWPLLKTIVVRSESVSRAATRSGALAKAA